MKFKKITCVMLCGLCSSVNVEAQNNKVKYGTYLLHDIVLGLKHSFTCIIILIISVNSLLAQKLNCNSVELVKDLIPGSEGIGFNYIKKLNNSIIFGGLRGIFVTDGSENGTFKLHPDLVIVSELIPYKNKLYFIGTDALYVSQIWSTDGTVKGTNRLTDFKPKGYNFTNGNTPLKLYKDEIYFIGNDGINGEELWKTDGTYQGTKMFKDIRPGQYGSMFDLKATEEPFVIIDNKLIFAAWDGVPNTSKTLWSTDGTSENTKPIVKNTELCFEPENMFVFNNEIYFVGKSKNNSCGPDYALFKTNGTEAGTKKIVDLKPNYCSGYYNDFIAHNGSLYFSAEGPEGLGLYQTDGSNINLIKSDNGIYEGKVILGDKLFFVGSDQKLWKTDGTPNGTVVVKKTSEGKVSSKFISSSRELFKFKDKIYFAGEDSLKGVELWESDGTDVGTKMVYDIQAAGYTVGASSYPVNFFATDSTLFFMADNGKVGYELWKLSCNSSISSFDKVTLTKEFTIYPNPTLDFIHLPINSKYVIYNFYGQSLLKGESDNVDVSILPKGIYLIKVNETSKKFIIE